MTAEITIEQLQARGWEQWQAWRATHLEITKESDETAWWTSMGRIASDLTPNDDATIIQLGSPRRSGT